MRAHIGARSTLSNFFYGAIDDVTIYNRAVTDVEAQQLYTLGQPCSLYPPNVTVNNVTLCGEGYATLTAVSDVTNVGYRWYDTGGNLVSIGNTFTPYVTVSTTFFVEVVTGGFTSPRKTAQITVNPSVEAIIVDPPTSVDECETVTLQADASGGTPPYTSYQWFISERWVTGKTYDHRFTDSGDQSVGLYVRDALGCDIIKTITISVNPDQVIVPNVFTPNGDGYNDSFGPFTRCLDLYNYSMEIYDRLGKLVATPENNWWDGRGLNGKFVYNALYYYYITMNSDTRPPLTFKGWVNVLGSPGPGGRIGHPEEKLSLAGSDGSALRVFPNPVKNALTLNYIFGQHPKGEMNYTIVDGLGRKAGNGSWKVGKEASFGEKTLDVSLLPSGVYHLRVWDETSVQSVRFVKQ